MKQIKITILLLLLTSFANDVIAQKKVFLQNSTDCDVYVLIYAVCSNCTDVGVSNLITLPASSGVVQYAYNDPALWNLDPNSSVCSTTWEYDFAVVSQTCSVSSSSGPTPGGCLYYDIAYVGRGLSVPCSGFASSQCFEYGSLCPLNGNPNSICGGLTSVPVKVDYAPGGAAPDDVTITVYY